MKNFVALDLETTGLNPEEDEIIEIAAVKFHNGEIESSYSSFVNTKKIIPPFITKLTGITSEMLAEAPDLEKVFKELETFIEHYPLVIHNAAFDLAFLKRKQKTLTNPHYDTLELIKIVQPTLGNYSLARLAEHFGIKPPAHRALEDAQTCGLLFLKIIRQLEQTPVTLLNYYVNLFNNPPSELGNFFQAIYLAKIKQNPIIKAAPIFGFVHRPRGIFVNEDNEKLENTVVFEPKKILDLFNQEGQFRKNYPNFEYRPEQTQMVAQICQALSEGKFLIIEAATGTGKSLAYLIPSIFWAMAKNEKVVISTHTINLQEQLLLKDIPLLKKALNLSIKVAVIKGRNNYLCLAKWQNLLQNPMDLSFKERYFIARITSWLQNSTTGDKKELNLKSSEEELWSLVCADSYTCLGKHCPWLENCFLLQARKDAEQAHIIITNHSLLLSDAKHENNILPKHAYLIVDEAHNLEQEATNQLTIELSSCKLRTLLNSLYISKGRYNTGILYNLKNQLIKYLNLREEVKNALDQAINIVLNLYGYLDNFSQGLINLDNFLGQREQKEKWLKAEVYQFEGWSFIKDSADNLILSLNLLAQNLILLSNFLEEEMEDKTESRRLQAYADICKEYGENAKMLSNLDNQDSVTWLEIENNKDMFNVILRSAPINVGPLIYDLVFKNKRSVIFTSATLTVENSFSFFINQVGLNYLPQEQIMTTIIKSPYNISERVQLCIVNNLPDPTQVTEERFGLEIAPIIQKLVTANQGRALVLFTSHRLLRQVYNLLKDTLAEREIQLFGHQIDGNRTYLIEEFKKTSRGVIFGANSFWEGVDIPGDSLTLIIIVKLPFQPPTQPTLAARMEYLKASAKDPFILLNLPQAIIKFKQGFGRLIRSSKDHGVVVVLDKRLIEKKYGNKFLNSLPLKTHFRGNDEEIANIITCRKQ